MKEFVELIRMVYSVYPNSTPTARNLRKGQKNKATAPKTQVRAWLYFGPRFGLSWPAGANGVYHSNQLDKLFHINPTCIFSELSL